MTGPEKIDLIRKFADKTEPGPVESWLSRMAAVAREVGMPLRYINWQNSPASVASNIINDAENRNLLDKMKELIDAL